mmetsp:Transcript_42190/g.77120  ORF Transcript_42190/g.77120 Transcript_42190/m.77120 type:complete len:176 (-) Transcript_42190:287-814(-)
MLLTMKKVASYVRGQGMWWKVRFLLVYLGNPAIFYLFLFIELPIFISVLGEDSWLTTKTVNNVAWLNPLFYLLVTLPVYIGWVGLVSLPARVDMEKLLDNYVSGCALITSIPGILNLFVWCTSGMEGNIMGFVFFLPLLIVVAVNFCLWIDAIRSSLRTPDIISQDGSGPLLDTV